MHKPICWFIIGAAALTSACLGPNPWLTLEECGQNWAITTAGAIGYDHTGAPVQITINGEPIVVTKCVTESQAQEILDPNSYIHQLLALDARLTCEQAAGGQGLVDDTCEDSLSAPYYVDTCLLEGDLCNPAGDTGETAEDTGETGDGGGFTNPTLYVDCDSTSCVVDHALIEQVLLAGPDDFAADGTMLAPHYNARGAQDGWEFSGITPGSLGAALQFQNGDVVTEVGGIPVDSWAAVIDVANAALHANKVTVRYIRGGKVLSRKFKRG